YKNPQESSSCSLKERKDFTGMETYLDALPQELINEILVRLENKTLPKLEDLFKINYEYLMILKYKDFYRDSKDIIKFDDSIITKYYQSSLIVQSNMLCECIYIDTDNK